jgi:hypothetical protein
MAWKDPKRMKTPQRKPVLADHVRRGKLFSPPLVELHRQTQGGKVGGVEWVRWSVPEVVWIALLQAALPPLRVSGLVRNLVAAGRKARRDRSFCLASDYGALDDVERSRLTSELAREDVDGLCHALGPLAKHFPTYPMNWLVAPGLDDAPADAGDLELIENVVESVLERRERPAMLTQCTVAFAILATEQVIWRSRIELNRISEYPATDESRLMGSQVRAMLNGLVLPRTTGSATSLSFWRRGRTITSCRVWTVDMPPPDFEALRALNETGTTFARSVFAEVLALAEDLPPDAERPEQREVILGLLQRQAQFAADVARDATLTMPPWAEMGLRAMAEGLIRIRWLLREDEDPHYQEFISYGLGQEKLRIEHLKRLRDERGLEEDDPANESTNAEISAREAWVNEHRYTFLQEVDVGGGTHGKDLRKLADESDSGELHRLVFQPLSSTVHGHWNAIGRLNLTRCASPLHGVERLPYEYQRPVRVGVIADALACYEDSYREIRGALLAEAEPPASSAVTGWFKAAQAARGWGLAEVQAEEGNPTEEEAGAE